MSYIYTYSNKNDQIFQTDINYTICVEFGSSSFGYNNVTNTAMKKILRILCSQYCAGLHTRCTSIVAPYKDDTVAFNSRYTCA